MKFTKILLIICVVALALTAVYAAAFVTTGEPPTPRICLKNTCFNVSIADTPAARERGLMFVQDLNTDAGMLFVFEQSGMYPFWMKNTFIPLDIVWLDENKKIVFIKNNAQPCGADACPNIVPSAAARYVLEVNAGTAAQSHWNIGDAMQLK